MTAMQGPEIKDKLVQAGTNAAPLSDVQAPKTAGVVDRGALLAEACLLRWESDPYQAKRFLADIKDQAAISVVLVKLYQGLLPEVAKFREQVVGGQFDAAVRTLKKMSADEFNHIPPMPEILDGAAKLSQAVESAWVLSKGRRDVLRNRLMNVGIDAARISENPEDATKNFLETISKVRR